MSEKEQLYYLLKHYYEDDYTTGVFVDEFDRIYNLEVDYTTLSDEENKLMGELSVITGRFSPCEEELKIPNVYFSESDVKQKATEVYLELIKLIK